MDKTKLLTFIEKYNLGGSIESVKLVADGKALKVGFVAEDKTLAGNVTLKSCDIEASELCIFETARLKTFLKSLIEDDVKITLRKEDDRLVGIFLGDTRKTINVVLADASVIPKAPNVKAPKDFDVEIPIDQNFIDDFVTSKNALPDVDSFTLMMNKAGDKLELVVGYAAINSNRITVNITPTAGKDELAAPISFNANYFREILLKNQESTGAVFRVSATGIASISFSTDAFDSNYFLIKKEIES